MNHFELDTFLRKYDPIEKIQVKTHQNIRDFDGQELTELDDDGIPRLPESYFFKNGPVDVFKHHRFADMPVHKHSFIEINYIYSGVCSQKIDGKTVNLQEGQICLLDSDVPHSIPALGENDILVNIIMKREIFSQLLVSRLQTSGIVSDFLANAVSENRAHDHYILFYSEDFPNLHVIVKNMFCEVFDGDEYSDQLLLNYIPILFTELMRVYRVDKNFEIGNVSRRANLIHILKYIEEHYHHCTLTGLADTFNFNPNYLGNMLKERTGKTFSELVQAQRMMNAAALLKNTDKSITEIGYEVGYESQGQFFKKFKQQYGKTPGQFRKES